MTRPKMLAQLFEKAAIAHEAMWEAEHVFAQTNPCDTVAIVANYLTWTMLAGVYKRAMERYVRACAAVESGSLEAMLEASVESAP